ncbi:MAG: imidazolonepropionase [Fidelibacterota bacterium]|nr:MAG: imidazolonepropionase [Candidatus Neomarinimicrobiota bacterium]
MSTAAADLLIVNAAEVVTCAGYSLQPARGRDQGELGIIREGAVAVADGRIIEVGRDADLRQAYPLTDDKIIDAQGRVVLPGFVDSHTHLVFAGNRAGEWEARMQGKSYLDILREGGGIQSTARAAREASFDELLDNARTWARRCLQLGTTTVEIKSGYGLDHDTEIKLLEVAKALGEGGPPRVVATYLGAHVVPPEYADDREGYLKLVETTAAEVRRRELAGFFDVFCEDDAFTLAEAERLLTYAKDLGFDLKLHAEQFKASGAAALGASLGAISVDHLEYIDQHGLDALTEATSTIAVLLPAVNFHLGMDEYTPAQRLIDAGVPAALATDLNPGSSFTPSIPMVIALACRKLKMTVAEAVIAATINAAHAVGLGAEVGSLEPGKRADLIICDVPDHRWLGYSFGWNPVQLVAVEGRRVVP